MMPSVDDRAPWPTDDDRLAAALRGFGPLGTAAVLAVLAGNFVIAPLGAVLALAWASASRTPWRELGFVRPRSWARVAAAGVALGVPFKLAMKAVVMPLLGAPPVNQAYHYLAGNRALIPWALVTMIVVAGFGEETLFRGYMFERLGKLLGTGAAAKTATVLLTTAAFALLHYPEQGVSGVEQAVATGLVFGAIFAVTGRIWVPMVAHAAFDLTAYAIIYFNLEREVAHLVFR